MATNGAVHNGSPPAKKARQSDDVKLVDASSALALARPNILKLEPYRCARDDYTRGVLLDANENGYGAVVEASSSLFGAPASSNVVAKRPLELHRYPCPYQWDLKEAIGAYRGLDKEQLFVGAGSDEAIDNLFRVFCEPRTDNVVITPPTYGMYKVQAAVHDVQVIPCPLTPGFDVDVEATLAAVTPRTKLLFICSPGNPTAKLVPLHTIERLLKAPELKTCMVVVDEAYVDMCLPVGDGDKGLEGISACGLLPTYPRLVVMHTLSKAFGLAGVRCGSAAGHPSVIQLLNNVKMPYNLNELTSRIALAAFEPSALQRLRESVCKIASERARIMAALKALSYVSRVFHSDSNFVLFQIHPAEKAEPLYREMADRGVVVRYRGDQKHCAGCIRATIGTIDENNTFLKTLGETAKSPPFSLL